jgi:hypothetical protein
LARLIEPAGHDEPGLLAFNGCRFGDLPKNRRVADRARIGDEADESGIFAHWLILTKLSFVPADLLAKAGLSAGLADSCGEKTSVHVFRWATNGAKDASRGRATGFAGAQAQRPPRGQSYTQ